MRKLPLTLGAPLVVAALALAATGCGAVQPTAATVNGERITQDSVDAELRELRDNDGYRNAFFGAEAEGSGRAGTFNSQLAAEVLTLRIYYELVDQELAERGIEVTAQELRDARAQLEEQVSQDPQTGQVDPARGKEVLGAFSAGYLDDLVRRQAQVVRLQSVLTEGSVSDERVQAYYEENPNEFVEVCARHVLVDTRADGDAVAGELRAPGADFAAVARARSKDPSAQENGGDLGCAPSASYVDPFAEAARTQPLNEVGAPVETNFGFHVIQVYERSTKPLDEVRGDIERQLQAATGDRLNEWLVEALDAASIKVNARFGRFDRTPEGGAPPRVVPPQPRTTTTTPAEVPLGG